jgi:hypothetical protein
MVRCNVEETLNGLLEVIVELECNVRRAVQQLPRQEKIKSNSGYPRRRLPDES